MKKFLSLFMVVLMVVLSFGCANNSGSQTSNESANQKLIVALNAAFPPYEFVDNGEITGIDSDMTREIGKRLGMEVEFLDIEFASIIPAIQSGKADIAATGMTVTEDRKNFVNFTDMYQDAVQSIIVTKDSPIKTKEDLQGKVIAVQTGTTGDLYCTDDYGDAALLRFPKILDGVQALSTGKVDACVIDDQVAISCVEEAKNKGTELVILPTAYVEEHYAMALNKNNTELLEKVNKALNDMMADGTLAKIKSKYLKD